METTQMCRCCATEGSFKDIKNPYYWMGEEEVYGDMLRECFDVKMSSPEHGGICEVCITQLRNAVNFRKQVITTEERFKKLLDDIKFKATIVKEEISADDEDKFESEDNGNQDDDEDYVPDYDIPIKTETLEVKPKKRASTAKATTSKGKRSKKSEEKSGLYWSVATVKEEPPSPPSSPSPPSPCSSDNGTEVKQKKPPRGEVISKMIENLKLMIKYSNASIIGSKKGLDYYCLYCDYKDRLPSELKAHFRDIHSDDDIKFKRPVISDFYVKLDLTDLTCAICAYELFSYEDLMDHLRMKHKIGLHTDVKNQFLPFKFEGSLSSPSCFLCNKVHESFKSLLEHVNIHYEHFKCKTCGVGFVNEGKLTKHAQAHRKSEGRFPCSYCTKVFPTKNSHKIHEGRHTKKDRMKCWDCDERFRDMNAKNLHMVEKHGADIQLNRDCHFCMKTFPNRISLKTHQQRVHLRMRPYECTECDMSFNKAGELRNHAVKHTGEKNFICKVCQKAFSRPCTLGQHMKIHMNDRKFKCEPCKMAFVQKGTWKKHMRTKHGETFGSAASEVEDINETIEIEACEVDGTNEVNKANEDGKANKADRANDEGKSIEVTE